jgi:hypothetical protein
MRHHFQNRDKKDTIYIIEEGMLPKCTKCSIQQSNVGPKHMLSKTCLKYSTMKTERENDTRNKSIMAETVFNINGTIIETVNEFKYLGRQITNNDCDWSAINYYLKKARTIWGRLARVLSAEKAEPKTMSIIYKAVNQEVILYGSESWALTKSMERRLQRVFIADAHAT